ncbi:hypothetical protein OSTOST_19449 [Ostertagia ostertagi]
MLTYSRGLWQKLAEQVHYEEGADEAEKDGMLYFFHRHGYEARRRTLARSFLAKRLCLNIFFTVLTSKEVRLAFTALVRDGVHDVQPDATNKLGQLYTIHGVLRTGDDVPLLYAVTTRNLWNKWDLHDLRTSNIAESYHNALKGLLNKVKYPRMSDLLIALRGYVTTSRGNLLDIE